MPTISPECKYTYHYEEFADLLNELDLTRRDCGHPTRNENILDLFLIDNPTLVKCVEVRSGIADYAASFLRFYKPQICKQKPSIMHLYKNADREGLETHMLAGISEVVFAHLLK